MAHHEPAPVDPRELQNAQSMWHNFTQLLKWSSIITAVTLVAMAAVFVDW